jgi:hypothetical protein
MGCYKLVKLTDMEDHIAEHREQYDQQQFLANIGKDMLQSQMHSSTSFNKVAQKFISDNYARCTPEAAATKWAHVNIQDADRPTYHRWSPLPSVKFD